MHPWIPHLSQNITFASHFSCHCIYIWFLILSSTFDSEELFFLFTSHDCYSGPGIEILSICPFSITSPQMTHHLFIHFYLSFSKIKKRNTYLYCEVALHVPLCLESPGACCVYLSLKMLPRDLASFK